ncbi:MAG: peptidase S16 [Actinobacteria bacterium]|nr:peptidase S16 [Actinomycetota bacterium]
MGIDLKALATACGIPEDRIIWVDQWAYYAGLSSDVLAASDPEFGVVLIERGHEVGGGDIRSMAGTVARIVETQVAPDGRRMVLALGIRRFRVHEWLPDQPYPVALVNDWPDHSSDGFNSAEVNRLFDKVIEVSSLFAQLGGPPFRLADIEISDDASFASFQLVALAPIGPADRQRLLVCADPASRLELLESALSDVEAACRFRLQGQ